MNKFILSYLSFTIIFSLFSVNASDIIQNESEGKQEHRIYFSFPKHVKVLFDFEPSNDFESASASIIKNVYTKHIRGHPVDYENTIFSEDQPLFERERYFIFNLSRRDLIETMGSFPRLLSNFEGSVNILALLTDLYFKNNLALLIKLTNLFLDENNLNHGQVECIETLLLFPLTYMRNIADDNWRRYENRNFVLKIRKIHERYKNAAQAVFYRLLFYKNKFYFRELNTYSSFYQYLESFPETHKFSQSELERLLCLSSKPIKCLIKKR
ncbi:MAG: hypothetical protein GW748_07090 [Alphaproteobacteria bacterium]|nr:hypothetical protein [Alphaproteobacteria bacterium]